MQELRRRTQDLLSCYSGHPDVPNGRPSGLWAYTIANGTYPRAYALGEGETVRRLRDGEKLRRGETPFVVDLPWLAPRSPVPRRLYYAAIETDPAGVTVATLPKGTQDLHARRNGTRLVVELGQKRQLVDLLRTFDQDIDLSGFHSIQDPNERHEAELQALHWAAVETLLVRGFDVTLETLFETARRETREEHGFDFERERPKVKSVDEFVELALSKRRPDRPIEHFVYAARVTDFDETLPRVSRITEDKDPSRQGRTYLEKGVFLTLAQMGRRLEEARSTQERTASGIAGTDLDLGVEGELRATASRLEMLGRIEAELIRRLRAEGLEVGSEVELGVN